MKIIKQFSNIDILKAMHPELLKQLIQEFPSYFGYYQVLNNDEINYEQLKRALVLVDKPEADAPPDKLLEILYNVSEMQGNDKIEELLEELQKSDPDYILGSDEHSPLDIALYTRLKHPQLFEDKYLLTKLSQKRSFDYFLGKNDTDTHYTALDEPQIKAVETEIGQWCKAYKRPQSVKCLVQEKAEDKIWFIIAHGEPLHREAKISENEENASIYYYPKKTDLLVYDKVTNHLQVKCESKKFSAQYRSIIGKFCFADEDYFEEDIAPFTLKPLMQATNVDYDWCQCTGITSVDLASVTIMHGNEIEIRKTNGDYFPKLVERNRKYDYSLNIIEATFKIKQIEQKNKRGITIKPNKVRYVRNEDSLVFEDWLAKHGFAQHVSI